jgi:hypothetical protein
VAAEKIRYTAIPNFSMTLQMAVAQTDSYDSAMGISEDDVAGVSSYPMLYGNCVRWAFVAQSKPFPFLCVSVKYGCMVKDGVQTLGSGWDTVQGNTESQCTVQLDAIW